MRDRLLLPHTLFQACLSEVSGETDANIVCYMHDLISSLLHCRSVETSDSAAAASVVRSSVVKSCGSFQAAAVATETAKDELGGAACSP